VEGGMSGGREEWKEGEVEKRDKGKITSVVHTHLQCKHREHKLPHCRFNRHSRWRYQ